MSTDLTLEHRDGLPDALRVLLEQYPREAWEAHGNFGGLIRFWLDRHLLFRRLLATMTEDSETALGGDMDPRQMAGRLSRLGGMFLGDLHGHHSIGDMHYFPRLVGLEPAIDRGFELLDADHKALDGHLSRFADEANAVLGAVGEGADWRPQLDEFRQGLGRFHVFLNRHLIDEEDLIVPVLLKHAPADLV